MLWAFLEIYLDQKHEGLRSITKRNIVPKFVLQRRSSVNMSKSKFHTQITDCQRASVGDKQTVYCWLLYRCWLLVVMNGKVLLTTKAIAKMIQSVISMIAIQLPSNVRKVIRMMLPLGRRQCF